jgi:hypothetical protein
MRLVLGIVVVAVLGAAFVFHEQHSQLEGELAVAATQLAGRPVHVHCQGFTGSLLDATAESGSVRFDANGKPGDTTDLKRPICDALSRFPHDVKSPAYGCVLALTDCPQSIWDDVGAVHTLAHESWHLRGIGSESLTECRALQTTAFAAELFGADPRAAQATAAYALKYFYPQLPDEYRTFECVNGGPLDLRPADPVWP